MEMKLATTYLHWSQHVVPHSSSSYQNLASVTLSHASRRRRGLLLCRYVLRMERSALFGNSPTKIHRSQSCENPKARARTIKRACSASLEDFSDEEFSRRIQELALRFQLSADDDKIDDGRSSESKAFPDSTDNRCLNGDDSCDRFGEEYSSLNSTVNFVQDRRPFPPSNLDSMELPCLDNRHEPPDWVRRDEIIPANIEHKAGSVDLPLSIRIIKRKMQWEEGIREAGESAGCSVKKAFSSMVFMIRELHCYTFRLREILFYEDLQGILVRVQEEIHASFVWLFQQVFSHTPTFMVYVMILLANFTVHSMSHNAAIAASTPPTAVTASVNDTQDHKHHKFDSSAIRTFSVSSSSGRTTSVGGNNGGGGKVRPVANGNDGDGRFDQSNQYRSVVPGGASQVSSFGTSREAEDVSAQEDAALWNSIVEEVSKMEAATRDSTLDHDTMRKFVSPVTAKIEQDDYAEYFQTELLYQIALSREPNNPLILANYAQFLYLVSHDYDRAEEHFKRAVGVEPRDAEAYNKYANFLWRARNDLWAAEETFLEAISADPNNSYYAANYAHFLWNTGGEDTCFPLSSPDATEEA